MGDRMHPIPFDKLVLWARREYTDRGAIFGIRKDKFHAAKGAKSWFSESLGTVLGPAAGPHSQLAQNIAAAYLAGSRFIELKTVQKMDGEELRACVPKPCIHARDEGYNVEWSTELTVEEAFDEYLKAWFLLHVLQKELDLAAERDFVFNMSVGYDLEGIKLPKIDKYIRGLQDASQTPVWQSCMAFLLTNIDSFEKLSERDLAEISPKICASITLSTLHGCPPEEIEGIARYLLEEKGLSTFVKCNPTLVGYETARGLLDEMGYRYLSFDDRHFKADLQFADAVPMLKRLQTLAADLGLGFGVKLSNTLPVKQKRGELPAEEMYLSGRALLPLTLAVAKELSQAFDGNLPISFSGGADAGNIDRIVASGIYPVTLATTILKPGGYERLTQMAKLVEPLMGKLEDTIDTDAVSKLANGLVNETPYRKEAREYESRKTDSELPLYDCFKAPCKDGGCPIEQQVPAYVGLVGEGKLDEAMATIAIDNAAPAITAAICSHPCQSKCTRMDYEGPIQIRAAKRVATEAKRDEFLANTVPAPLRTDKKAVIIGAGPAGIAAGLYLRRNGVDATVLERRERPFGMVAYVIPAFRIAEEVIGRDYRLAVNAGVKFQFAVADPAYSLEALKTSYDYVIIATGAWGKGKNAVKEGSHHLRDALELLADAKAKGDKSELLGARVAIIGGGDVAMDAARVAARNPGTKEAVIVYRRTKEFMPAQKEEIRGALEDGVQILELLNPIAYDGKVLSCEKMALGDYDSAGRRAVTATGETVTLPFDTVISATGATVETEAMAANGIALDQRGYPRLTAAHESGIPGVYVAGDCRRGPATVVRAMADAKTIARDILEKIGLEHDFIRLEKPLDKGLLYDKKGVYFIGKPPAHMDSLRCLNCNQLCEICNDVCPNRANVHLAINHGIFRESHQILHIDGMCNECGNCETFCPHKGSPYLDKVTVFWSEAGFSDSKNVGFLLLGDGRYRVRTESGDVLEYRRGEARLSPQLEAIIKAVEEKYPYYLLV